MDLTTKQLTTKPSTIIPEGDKTEGIENDTPLDECNCSNPSSTSNRYSQSPSEDSDTPSESMLKPRQVSNISSIPGINVSVSEATAKVDINQMVERCVISTNTTVDTISDDEHVEMGTNISPASPVQDIIMSNPDAIGKNSIGNIVLDPKKIVIGMNAVTDRNFDIVNTHTNVENVVTGKIVTNISIAQCSQNVMLGANITLNMPTVPFENASMGKNIMSSKDIATPTDSSEKAKMGKNVTPDNILFNRNTVISAENAMMGINVTSNTNVDPCENAVMGKNVTSNNEASTQNVVLSVENAAMGINVTSDNIVGLSENAVMGKNINTNNTTDQMVNDIRNVESVEIMPMLDSDATIDSFDPYRDAQLSGALEQLSAMENTAIDTLATMDILHQIQSSHSSEYNYMSKEVIKEYPNASDDQMYCHTYCQMIDIHYKDSQPSAKRKHVTT